MHLLDLAAEIKQSVQKAGLVGYRFNTVGVSDGISMGTNGMSFSLQSREVIADSIETVMNAQWYDANVSIPGCDKNMPGCVIGACHHAMPARWLPIERLDFEAFMKRCHWSSRLGCCPDCDVALFRQRNSVP
jgi:dihydroxyacid dehydratase/phosphogluconate dehydratase